MAPKSAPIRQGAARDLERLGSLLLLGSSGKRRMWAGLLRRLTPGLRLFLLDRHRAQVSAGAASWVGGSRGQRWCPDVVPAVRRTLGLQGFGFSGCTFVSDILSRHAFHCTLPFCRGRLPLQQICLSLSLLFTELHVASCPCILPLGRHPFLARRLGLLTAAWQKFKR